jgi:hypothetical protein
MKFLLLFQTRSGDVSHPLIVGFLVQEEYNLMDRLDFVDSELCFRGNYFLSVEAG